MPLTKTMVLDTIKLGKFAYDNGFDELNIVDEKGLEKYNTILKPKIQEFAGKYGNTPNIFLKKFVQEYIEKNNLQKDFIGQGFHFKGRGRVHTNTWGGIYSNNEKGLSDRFSPNTQLPQLYCTINHNTIHFGFSYGKNTKGDDLWVQRIRENSELLKKIIQLKQKDDELSIQCNEILEDDTFGERIEIDTFEDLAKNWSEAAWIGKVYPKSRIPDDIEEKITDTFDKLLELFVFGSIGQQIPVKKYIGGIPVRYWKIAPNAGAKDWEYCKEHGIIPIYFNEYLSNSKESVLEFNQDQLLKYCQKKFPKSTKAKTGANVELIWDFVHNVQIGDYILANQGIGKALGWGIITSKPKIFEGDLDATIYRDVDWKNTSLNKDLTKEQGKNFFRTIYEMTKEQFESIIKNPPSQAMRKQLILYGPPGTGKTYNAILKAHEILFGFEDRSATYKIIKENLSSQKEKEIDPSGLSWLDAIILSFDELNKDKVSVNEIKDTRIIREFTSFKNNRTISNSIWHFLLFESALDSDTIKVKNRGSQELFDKDTESRWFLTEKGKIYRENLREDIKSSASLSDSQFSFITFHQSYSYEDFIEGIRPDISDVSVGEQISYRIKDGLFKDICKKAAQDPSKNYVLVIDEINRGNISKIFGELITILEENKRMGEREEVTVRLPYSGEEFRIPNNVFIIGTMNSTDKSIALVDIALRRRFHFERLGVRLSLIQNNDARKFLESLNNIICALKNPDYEIGHSYFMIIPEEDPDNKELTKVFVNQILPLIEEYFFNDWEALATILGKDSIKIEKRKKFVWDEDNGKFEEETGDYDKIYGRCLAPIDEIFKNTKKNLERFQSKTD